MDIGYFDFEQQMASIEWIKELPAGLVSSQIDLRFNHVAITRLDSGYQVYIGPIAPELGGDAIVVILDKNQKLTEHYIERIESEPIN